MSVIEGKEIGPRFWVEWELVADEEHYVICKIEDNGSVSGIANTRNKEKAESIVEELNKMDKEFSSL